MHAPLRLSSASSMRGRLYASLTARAFNFLRSMQNLKEPSFLRTRTMGLAQGLLQRLIALYQASLLDASAPPCIGVGVSFDTYPLSGYSQSDRCGV